MRRITSNLRIKSLIFGLFFLTVSSNSLASHGLRHFIEWKAARLFKGFNIHLLDTNNNGFEIYRMGAPGPKDMKTLCDKGISEVLVLSGNSHKHEQRYNDFCPGIKIVEVSQSVSTPLNHDFLQKFDEMISKAKSEGKKIAFRCTAGAHRTGRLSAYYELKYKHLELDQALNNMKHRGLINDILFPQLTPQVEELNRYINGDACVQKPHCVVNSPFD